MVLMTVAVGQHSLVVRITIWGSRAGTFSEVDSGDAFCISNKCFKMDCSKVENCLYLRGSLREVGRSLASAGTGENVRPRRLTGPGVMILPVPCPLSLVGSR